MASPIEKLRADPVVAAGVVVAIAVAGWFVYGALTTSEKERIEQTINGVAAAIEAQDSVQVMDHFSQAYDDKGGLTHKQLGELLPVLFKYMKIKPGSWRFMEPPDINVENRLASVRIYVQSGVTVLADGRPFPVTSEWVIKLARPGDRWKVTSAHPEEVMILGKRVGGASGLLGLILRGIRELGG